MNLPQPKADAEHDSRPNILLLTAHDAGREFGCYGRQAYTPMIDQMANESAVFENHFASGPTCHPSRASANTGILPHNNGMLGHGVRPHDPNTASGRANKAKRSWSLNDGVPTLSMFLNDRGYNTYLRGGDDFHWGEDSFELDSTCGAREVADSVEEILTDQASNEDPFFIRANPDNAHYPYSTRDGGFKEDPVPGYEGPTAEEINLEDYPTVDDSTVDIGLGEDVRKNFEAFYEDMYEFDYAVGRILETLEETDQLDNTIVIVTTDHGIPNTGEGLPPKGKLTNYDRGIEAGLIIRYPDRVEPGRYQPLLSNVDLLPTVLDLVDGQPPYEVDGRSFRPLIDSTDPRDYAPRDAIYSENTYFGNGFYQPERAIRTERYKLIRHFWPNWEEGSDVDQSTEVELYDLKTDPDETTNLAENPRYFEIRNALYNRLRTRLIRDGDPLVEGPIPPRAFDTDV